ncbi:DUF2723 domain-containing protein [bacterium]|nr:DUF2723 domain-containing protein [bacterium]
MVSNSTTTIKPPNLDLPWFVVGGLVSFCVFLSTLAPGLVWENFGEDGGELTIASAFLGVPHPSGYPFFVLLGYLFCLLPIGNFAYRTNLLSAVSGAFAAGAAVWIVRILNRKLKLDLPAWVQCFIGVIICLGRTLWSQAVITEVYSLHTALNLLMIAFLLSWNERSKTQLNASKHLFGAFIFLGLALGVHLTSAFLGLGFLFFLLATDWKTILRKTFWVYVLTALLLVLFLYSLLPLLASRNPPLNWSYIRSVSDLWNHVSGVQYRYRMFIFSGIQIFYRLTNQIFPWFLNQWGIGGFIVILIGAIYGLFLVFHAQDPKVRRVARRGSIAWLLFWFPPFYYALNYNIEDLAVYFALPFTLIAFLYPLGLAAFSALSNYLESPKWSVNLGLLIGCLIPLNGVCTNYSAVNLSRNRLAMDFGSQAFSQLPLGSIIISDYDGRTNSLLYERWLGKPERKDVVVILRSMLATRWYRDHLRELYPDLRLSEPAEWALGLPWDDLCNHMGREILSANADRPLFVVKENKFIVGNLFSEMFHGLFRLKSERSEIKVPVSPPFFSLNLSSIANSDYRGDPFRPGVRASEPNHYPFLGEGKLTSPAGTPFWLSPPTIDSGTPPVFTTCYQASVSAKIPLIATFSTALHFALVGGVSRTANGPLAIIKITFENGKETVFPVEKIKDYRDSDKMNLEFLAIPMIPTLVPKLLEIEGGKAKSPEGFVPGIAVFSITQEASSPSIEKR